MELGEISETVPSKRLLIATRSHNPDKNRSRAVGRLPDRSVVAFDSSANVVSSDRRSRRDTNWDRRQGRL
jgi:hypothetical protein